MPRAHGVRTSDVQRTARVMQMEGMFDVPPSERNTLSWDVDLPIEDRDWNVGLIVGPSGSGKSTVARQLFPDQIVSGHQWDSRKSVLDDFPAEMSIREIVELLSSVGFSSPPAWLRPFGVLSTGEQFRVTMARVMAEQKDLAVVDEFTSVVDRTVAQIGSAALAKTVRRRKQKFIAVTCHFDVVEWLQPDWIYRPDLKEFQWRELHRFPRIQLRIERVHHSAWKLFRQHHYLDTSLSTAAVCFVAFWGDHPVAFSSWLPLVGHLHKKREHRTVTLPDFQGVGIGNRVSEFCASIFVGLGNRVYSTTSHPAMIQYRHKSPMWMMKRSPGFTSMDMSVIKQRRILNDFRNGNSTVTGVKRATTRLTAGFEYIGPAMDPMEATAILGKLQ